MRRAIVVTGASTGIGAATVRRLVAMDFDVFGSVRRPEDGRAIEAAGATPLYFDVTDAAAIAAAAESVSSRLGGGLAGLVNNAGIPAAGPLELLPIDDLRRVLEVNVVGVIAVTQVFLPLLRAARGRIVNVSSVSGRIAWPFLGPYSASKFALEALSDSLRRELMHSGVDVIVVEPGSVRTPIWDKASLDPKRCGGTIYEGPVAIMAEAARRGGERGLEPDVVAEVIAKALTARRPPARMVVVSGSPLKHHLVRLLPDRWLDRLVAARLRPRP